MTDTAQEHKIPTGNLMAGKRGLVMGVANDRSIAWAIARSVAAQGGELAFTYQGEALEKRVRPLATSVGSDLVMPCDVTDDASVEAVFQTLGERWGKLDFLVHAIGFANKEYLRGRYIDTPREAFLQAMDISCWSFIRMAKLAEPLLAKGEHPGGALFCMSYYGASMVVEHYNLMGPVKAALESLVRYLAAELGPQGVRVHAISPGPLPTRAASGLQDFDALMATARAESPLRRLVTLEEVGALAAFLAGPGGRGMSGQTLFVDAGFHVVR